jgi:hypothetical protein
MRWLRVLTLLVAGASATAVYGDDETGDGIYMDGNTLFSALSGTGVDPARAWGYIIGVSDALNKTPSVLGRFCVPANSTMGQTTDVVKKWLADHPQFRHHTAPSLVQAALVEAYPCPPSVQPPAPKAGNKK